MPSRCFSAASPPIRAVDAMSTLSTAFLASLATLAQPEDLTLGRLVLGAYAQGSKAYPLAVDLSALGFRIVDTWLSRGDFEPYRCFGIVAEHPVLGRHLAIRGTDDLPEWVEDAEFWPIPCLFAPKGVKTEHGFTQLVLNGRLASGRPAESLMQGGELALDGVEGHSLGAAIAEGMAGRFGVPYAGLWACPRFGNDPWRDWLLSRCRRVFRPYMAGDFVPDLPADFPPFRPPGWPPLIEYVHPPGFEVENLRSLNNPGARHALLTYLNAFDPGILLDPEDAVTLG